MRPYDRLIGAALEGVHVSFARQDAVEAAWRVVDPILGDVVPVHQYARGSWGPKKPTRSCPPVTPGITRPADTPRARRPVEVFRALPTTQVKEGCSRFVSAYGNRAHRGWNAR